MLINSCLLLSFPLSLLLTLLLALACLCPEEKLPASSPFIKASPWISLTILSVCCYSSAHSLVFFPLFVPFASSYASSTLGIPILTSCLLATHLLSLLVTITSCLYELPHPLFCSGFSLCVVSCKALLARLSARAWPT